MKRRLVIISIVLLLIISTSCVTPYLIPLSKPQPSIELYPFPDSEYIKVNGILFHYRFGKPSTDPIGYILLVHGFGGSTYSFQSTIKPLNAAGFVTVAVDLPGFGYSERSNELNHSQNARGELLWTFIQLIDANLESHTWHLAGHSMGAATVATMA